jgi:WD40 repeat protein
MKMLRIIPLLLVTVLVGAAEKSAQPIPIAPLQRTTPVDFESEILPFLRASCVACHSRTKAKSGLVLETPQTILKGSEDGPVIVPGKSAESRLLDLAAHADKPIMPPRDNKASAPDLTPAQLALLTIWIDQGARGEVHAEPIHWRPIASSFTPAYAVAVTANGQLAAVGRANRLDLYDLFARQLLPPLVDPGLSALGPAAHRDAIYAIAFSPDGMRLASGSFAEVKIWRRTPPTAALSLNRDLGATRVHGAQLSTGECAGMFPMWNRESSRELSWMTHDKSVTAIALRADGKRFAAGGENGIVKIWDIGTHVVVRELKGDPALLKLAADRDTDDKLAAADVAFFNSRLASAQADEKSQRERSKKADDAKTAAERVVSEKQAIVKSAADGKLQAERALADAAAQRDQAVASLAKPEQLLKDTPLATASSKPTSRLAATAPTTAPADPAALRAARVKAAELAKAAVTKSEAVVKQTTDRIAAAAKPLANAEAALKVAELARANAANEADLATAAVTRAALGVTGAKADLTATEAKKAKTAADAGLAQKNAAASASRPIRSLAFSPDGRILAVAPEGLTLHLWNADTGAAVQSIATGNDTLQSVEFIDADHLLTSSDKHIATLWTIRNPWTLERTLGTGDAASPLSDRVNALAFSPDGRTLVSGAGEPTRGGEIKFWDVATGDLVRELKDPHSDAVLSLAFSRDGARLASGAADRFVRVFDVATGRRIFSLEGHAHHVLGVAFKADGRRLVSSAADGQAKLWNLVSGERMGAVPPVTKELTFAHFIGTSDQALLGSSDGQFRIINEAGASVRTFVGPAADFVHAAALASNNSTLLCATQSGTLYVWDATTGQPQFSLRAPERK